MRAGFSQADPDELAELMIEHHLDSDNVVLDQNILVLDDGDRLVIFDAGVGRRELGRRTFGPQTGQLLSNLKAAGFEPEDIDIVALTHAHPDHCWGLLDEAGNRLYPNARLAVSPVEFEYWTDMKRADSAPTQHAADHFIGAHGNLIPYADRLIEVTDGTEIARGIRAIATPGHSPDHIAYEISSDGERLLFWGDVCHHSVVLLRRPDWPFQFDFDSTEATAQRHRIYEYVTANRIQVLAYHFPFPGRGHLLKRGDEFEWLPISLDLYLPQGVQPGIPDESPLRA